MVALSALWLPIILSVVAVFVLSSIIHMFSPWHKSDYPGIPNEDAVADALRPFAIPPGDYLMPRPGTREGMKSPEFAERMNKGPNLIVTVLPNGPRPMGPLFIGWLIFVLVVTLFSAYIAARFIPPGATADARKYVGLIAFIGYSLALWPDSIWFHRKWSTTIKSNFDGLVYAAATALIFAWLWPK